MAIDWDEPMLKTSSGISIGEDLKRLSVAELEARILTLKAEITRVEAEVETKRKQQSAADALFRR